MVEGGGGKKKRKKAPLYAAAWSCRWQKVGHSCWVFFSGKAKLGCERVEAACMEMPERLTIPCPGSASSASPAARACVPRRAGAQAGKGGYVVSSLRWAGIKA